VTLEQFNVCQVRPTNYLVCVRCYVLILPTMYVFYICTHMWGEAKRLKRHFQGRAVDLFRSTLSTFFYVFSIFVSVSMIIFPYPTYVHSLCFLFFPHFFTFFLSFSLFSIFLLLIFLHSAFPRLPFLSTVLWVFFSRLVSFFNFFLSDD
jgi:hypothetical protein